MKKFINNIISVLIAATMILGVVVAGVAGIGIENIGIEAGAVDYTITEGFYTYTVDDNNEATIVDVNNDIGGNITIPTKTYGGYQVTVIGDLAFQFCTKITGITIPDSVEVIKISAFLNCEELKTITFGNGIKYIKDKAFENCTKLESIYIPESVISIGQVPFYRCHSLKNITVDSKNTKYLSDEYGVLFNKNKTELIQYPTGNTRKTYSIPNGVQKINADTFYGNDYLETIVIHETVTEIGGSAFHFCSALNNISLPENIIDIGYGAFRYTGYYNNESNWENGILYKDLYLLEAKQDLTGTVNIKEGTVSILPCAFYNCEKIENVKIPNSIIYIGQMAFYGCQKLSNVEIPYKVMKLEHNVFGNCYQLKSITIPNSVESIAHSAFYECNSLTDVYYYGTEEEWKNLSSSNTKLQNVTVHYKNVDTYKFVLYLDEKTELYSQYYKVNENIVSIPDPIQYGYIFKGWIDENGNSVSIPTKMPAKNLTFFAVWEKMEEENIYNLGEETYKFQNFGDNDSEGGHCFGMSVTSSAYYMGELDVTELGIDSCSELYTLNRTSKVQKPICYYQGIQGSYRNKSIVAGGMPFVSSYFNIQSDWTEVIDYVKNHEHDNKGTLMVVDYSKYQGGHAMNFLYYINVNGQDRIYVYDNNFPDTETYFYKDSSGNIKQYPKATLSNLDSIGLMDIGEYLKKTESFDVTRVIYAYAGEISINGVEGHLMFGEDSGRALYMYELPQSADQIKIIPLVDNAEFTYIDEEYTFGAINESTVGTLDLVTLGAEDTSSNFKIINGGSEKASSIDITPPSTTTISYGDSIILHTDVSNLPAGATIKWTASNGNFSYSVSDNGATCTISPESSGDTTFTATVYDANGNVISSDEQIMTSKAGFFQKIIAFFKKLFGLTKTIPQIYKGIF